LSRISLAFKALFAILFKDDLPAQVASAYGYVKESAAKAAPPKPAAQEIRPSDGALQMLGILQRDAQLIDFIMAPGITEADDQQVAAVLRDLQPKFRETLMRYVEVKPVIDSVENTQTSIPSRDPNTVRLIGNADKPAKQGILRHKGWQVAKVSLPKLAASQNVNVLAPAEIEIE
jgi:hypothetical protein